MNKGALTVFNLLQSGASIGYSCGDGEEYGTLNVTHLSDPPFHLKVHWQDFDLAKKLSEIGDNVPFEKIVSFWNDNVWLKGYIPLTEYIQSLKKKGWIFTHDGFRTYVIGKMAKEIDSTKRPTKIKSVEFVGPQGDIPWICIGRVSVSMDRLLIQETEPPKPKKNWKPKNKISYDTAITIRSLDFFTSTYLYTFLIYGLEIFTKGSTIFCWSYTLYLRY